MLMVVMAALTALQGPEPGPVTPSLVAGAKAALDERLFDYPSARFRDVRGRDKVLCGFVNAKNRMGAYSGWSRFAYITLGGEPSLYMEDRDNPSTLNMLDTACGVDGLRNQGADYSDRLTHR